MCGSEVCVFGQTLALFRSTTSKPDHALPFGSNSCKRHHYIGAGTALPVDVDMFGCPWRGASRQRGWSSQKGRLDPWSDKSQCLSDSALRGIERWSRSHWRRSDNEDWSLESGCYTQLGNSLSNFGNEMPIAEDSREPREWGCWRRIILVSHLVIDREVMP